MQLRLPWDIARSAPRTRQLLIGSEIFPVDIVRHRWATRYIVRVTNEGRVRLTVPRGASIDGGLKFAASESDWIGGEWQRLRRTRASWSVGTPIWFRGEKVTIALHDHALAIGPERIPISGSTAGYGELIAAHLRRVAGHELPARCLELAGGCELSVARVSVRDQKSRWGACSPARTITLNWRLIQMPSNVSDYVILHELMHLRQANHSRRFWREVDRVCPCWREAERWLRRHGRDLL